MIVFADDRGPKLRSAIQTETWTASRALDWQPRSNEEAVLATARSLTV